MDGTWTGHGRDIKILAGHVPCTTLPIVIEPHTQKITSKKSGTSKEKPLDKKSHKKSKFQSLNKNVSTIMTRYSPSKKANICEIVVYDIPSTIPQLDILTNLGKWGQVIAMKIKTQRKYQTVTVSIDFNEWAFISKF